MEKELKLNDEQLRLLRSKLDVVSKLYGEVGMLETRKHEVLHDLSSAKERLRDYQEDLRKEYGDISINIDDGTYTTNNEE